MIGLIDRLAAALFQDGPRDIARPDEAHLFPAEPGPLPRGPVFTPGEERVRRSPRRFSDVEEGEFVAATERAREESELRNARRHER